MTKLPLTKGFYALIDDEDFAVFGQFKWCVSRNPDGRRPGSKPKYYAVHRTKLGRVYLHREIMKARKGLVVNHRCANGLDCRRENMHCCTQKTNNQYTHSDHETSCECWEITGANRNGLSERSEIND